MIKKKIDKVRKELAQEFADNLIMNLSNNLNKVQYSEEDGYSWGFPSVNYVCTGSPNIGLVRGRIYEIFGNESSGKTTLCIHAMAEVQARGGTVAMIDSEHAINLDYAQKLGVNLDEVLISQPDSGEEALELIEKLCIAGVDLIITDSVAALTPRSIMEAQYDKQHMGVQARMMSQGMAKLSKVISKHRNILVFTNQTREKIGVLFGDNTTTPGGKALKFYAAVRMATAISTAKSKAILGVDTLGKKTGNRIGSDMKVGNKKNKLTSPFKETTIPLLYGLGLDYVSDVYNLAVMLDIVQYNRGSYTLPDESKVSSKTKQENLPVIIKLINVYFEVE